VRCSPALCALVAVLVALVVGCNFDADAERDSGEVRVVASTALIAEFASTIAGDDAVVVELIPAGADLHSFEPAPAVAAAIAQADLVLINGHDLEGTLLEVIEQNTSDGVPIVAVSDWIEALFRAGEQVDDGRDQRGGIDPHLWLDARNAMHYVEQIRDALIEIAPADHDGFRERSAVYLGELQALHEDLVAQLASIPDGDRQLIVFHDAYRYFAAGYGLELLATLLPAGAQQEPAARTIAKLIELIEESGVRIVFAEPQFNSAVIEHIAAEADVGVGTLYSTFSGEIDSYMELMQANADALTKGLAS
jgi:manganese/iron transport system substrate-binding protein